MQKQAGVESKDAEEEGPCAVGGSLARRAVGGGIVRVVAVEVEWRDQAVERLVDEGERDEGAEDLACSRCTRE
jgi:hypothetical protein